MLFTKKKISVNINYKNISKNYELDQYLTLNHIKDIIDRDFNLKLDYKLKMENNEKPFKNEQLNKQLIELNKNKNNSIKFEIININKEINNNEKIKNLKLINNKQENNIKKLNLENINYNEYKNKIQINFNYMKDFCLSNYKEKIKFCKDELIKQLNNIEIMFDEIADYFNSIKLTLNIKENNMNEILNKIHKLLKENNNESEIYQENNKLKSLLYFSNNINIKNNIDNISININNLKNIIENIFKDSQSLLKIIKLNFISNKINLISNKINTKRKSNLSISSNKSIKSKDNNRLLISLKFENYSSLTEEQNNIINDYLYKNKNINIYKEKNTTLPKINSHNHFTFKALDNS